MQTMLQLSEADQERIRKAIAAAEARTSGEIVPYLVAQSGRYDVAVWRGASFAAVGALALVMLIFQVYDGWGLGWLHTSWGPALLAVLAGTLGALAGAYLRPVTRLLAGADLMATAVHQRAMQAFVEEEVFNTRDRTGILLFISLLEHRIEVVGDTGINQAVSEEAWVEVVDTIRDGIRGGRFVDGLVEAIDQCGRLLEKRGVALRSDDVNELPDALRIRRDH